MSSTVKKQQRRRQGMPRPPSVPRVAVGAPPLRKAEGMATLANKLIAEAAANPGLLVTPPYIPPLQAAATALGSAITAAQGGTDAAQTALYTATKKTRDVIKQHASWVQGGANALASADAVSFITAAGFQVAKSPRRVSVSTPTITNGAPTVVNFELPLLAGAIMWFTQISSDGGKTFAEAVDTEKRKGAITGLTSGQTVTVRVRAFVRGSGYTPWTTLSIVVT
jgi:hypothetical protein